MQRLVGFSDEVCGRAWSITIHQFTVLLHGREGCVFVARDHLGIDQIRRVVFPARLTAGAQEVEHRHAADEREVGDGDIPVRIPRVANKGGRGRVRANDDDRIRVCLAQNVHLLAEALLVGGAPRISGFPDHRERMFLQRPPHAVPAASAVGISLIQHSDALAANLDEMIHQSLSLLPVRRP